MICPLCHQPTSWENNPWRPFCSERCQLTDLGTWAAEQYRIPGPSLMTEASMPESDNGDEEQDGG
ncbi:MAG: DNA gyrase inhibitor YacG [Nitrospirae bacterium]|nr:DNA gyrase inhibitor YacG [Nitrospirota bacterium]